MFGWGVLFFTMKISKTFDKTLNAYRKGFRFIINSGGSRSSKTYSTLQLLYLIAKNAKSPLIIHIVSVSIPHLRDGAITDFDQILQNEGENLDDVKIKSPYTYTIGNSTIRFIGADKIGSTLGAQRDILFINEANNMKWKVVHQLVQRTTETVFIDYNPSIEFWVDQEGVSQRDNAIVLNSTYLDNIDNLTAAQITEFEEGKKKHDEEVANDIQGHWQNWWKVYGLGEKGTVEGAIITNYKIGEFDETLPYYYGMDFGYKDPFVCVKVAFDKSKMYLYVEEIVYKSLLSPKEIIKILEKRIPNKNSLIVADSADPTQIRGIKNEGFNIIGLGKEKIVIGLRNLQNWTIVITKESHNIIKETQNYKWLDKKGEVPIDDYNHGYDSIRYTEKYYRYKNS